MDPHLQLIYVGSVGEVGEHNICDFYFSADAENSIGDAWEMGARDNVYPPDPEYVQEKYRLVAPGLSVRLLEEEYERSYLDGVRGLVALAWEEVDYTQVDLTDMASAFLGFTFGETLESVLGKLQARGFSLDPQKLDAPAKNEENDGADEDEADDPYPSLSEF